MPELPKIILIVEDESSLMLVLHDRLRDEGFRIFQAANGQEALDLALKEHPDLIMLDLLMPVMDGVTMLKELRKDEWGKEVKVLVLTNLSTDEKLDEVKEFGVEDYLVKSDWKIEDVVQKIKNLMP
jgi:DNA-binding response OmpR family regulator